MESLISGLPNIRISEKIRDDDAIDQLHHFVTVYMFVFMAVIIGIKEYAGAPLDCWYTTNSWKHFQDHANAYCWSHKLFRYPDPNDLSKVPYPLDELHGGPAVNSTIKDYDDFGEINFYRWITVIFVVQAFLFKFPNLLWAECNEYSGTQIEKMVTLIGDITFEKAEKRRSVFAGVAEFLEVWLKINRKPFWFMKSRVGRQTKKVLQHCMLCVGANTGNYLSSMYIIIKGLFLLNILLQFIILTAFLEFNYWGYGTRAMQRYSEGLIEADSEHFPRIALCHFQVREKGEWIQCLLTINMLLEKIFLLEWFWLLLLLLLTVYSFISWLMKVLSTEQSVKFVRKFLSVINEDGRPPEEGRKTIFKFVVNYLGNDGVFVLRILSTNTNDVVMSEMMRSMWARFLDYENKAVNPATAPDVAEEPSADLSMDEVELQQFPPSEKWRNSSEM